MACDSRRARVGCATGPPCRRYAHDAGFGTVTILPVEHDFWRFYRLDP
jgi:hypothetical protein